MDFYQKNNLHVLLTDAMNQAALKNEENPSMFMAQYFLKEAGTDIKQHFRKKIAQDQGAIATQKKKLAAVLAEYDAIKERRDELSQMLADRAARGCGEDEAVGSPGLGKDMAAFKQVMQSPLPSGLSDHTYFFKDKASTK